MIKLNQQAVEFDLETSRPSTHIPQRGGTLKATNMNSSRVGFTQRTPSMTSSPLQFMPEHEYEPARAHAQGKQHEPEQARAHAQDSKHEHEPARVHAQGIKHEPERARVHTNSGPLKLPQEAASLHLKGSRQADTQTSRHMRSRQADAQGMQAPEQPWIIQKNKK